MGGLQAQYAPSMYIGLWSRARGLRARRPDPRARGAQRDPGDADAEHDPPRLARGLLAARDRGPRGAPGVVAARDREGDRAEMEAAAERLRAALADGATLRRKEIDELLGKAAARGVGLWVDLVRAPPSGTWERRRADLYALAEDWIGPPPTSRRDDAVDHLVTPLPGRLRPGHGQGRRVVHRPAAARRRAALERLELAPLDERAARPPGRTAARPGHARAGALPRHLGREPARARPPHRLPARGAPAEDLPHEDAAVVPDLPRRRRGRRHVALREGPGRARAVRPVAKADREQLDARPSASQRCTPDSALRSPAPRRTIGGDDDGPAGPPAWGVVRAGTHRRRLAHPHAVPLRRAPARRQDPRVAAGVRERRRNRPDRPRGLRAEGAAAADPAGQRRVRLGLLADELLRAVVSRGQTARQERGRPRHRRGAASDRPRERRAAHAAQRPRAPAPAYEARVEGRARARRRRDARHRRGDPDREARPADVQRLRQGRDREEDEHRLRRSDDGGATDRVLP